MNKFDNILKQYITELNVDPKAVGQNLGNKIGTPDQQTQNALKVLGAVAQSGDKDPIHQKLIQVINPETKETFGDIFKSESEKTQALERLTKMGIPIGSVQKEETPNQTETQNTEDEQKTPINKPTQSVGSSTSYGGQLQGI
jgi:hypothetical protein